MKLAVITASLNPEKTREYWESWKKRATGSVEYIIVHQHKHTDGTTTREGDWDDIVNTPDILGVVPAFHLGIAVAAARGADVIAAFHDDMRIDEDGWDTTIINHFKANWRCQLAGFSGADGLGDINIYRTPYNPMHLARQGFFSNMYNAEMHGRRELKTRLSACADGFSAIGRTSFLTRAFERMRYLGIKHHFYDGMLGAYARMWNGECWYLPVKCHHAGGVTAVGNASYTEWAKRQIEGGDQGFWDQSHRIGYEELRTVLPLRITS